MIPDDARRTAIAERRAQGLPDQITDPATIARVVALLRAPHHFDTSRVDAHRTTPRGGEGTPPHSVE